jgi:hypothetical protein
MKTWPGRRWLLPAVLGAAIVVGLAAGIVLARGGTSSGVVKGHPAVLARGAFRTVSWGTTGRATVSRDASGRLTLRFSSDFQTQRAPVLFVYLVKYRGAQRTLWKEVANLKRAWGSQEYDLPASASHELGAAVAVYCGKCNKIWGLAQLAPARSQAT